MELIVRLSVIFLYGPILRILTFMKDKTIKIKTLLCYRYIELNNQTLFKPENMLTNKKSNSIITPQR